MLKKPLFQLDAQLFHFFVVNKVTKLIVMFNLYEDNRMTGIRLIGVWYLCFYLSGCSIVVFEDSSFCPDPKKCPSKIEPSVTSRSQESSQELSSEGEHQAVGTKSQKVVKSTFSIEGYTTYFDYDSAVIGDQALQSLQEVAKYLNENSQVNILVEGHCDERGTREYNIALGEKRAESVRSALSKFGVARDRINTTSFGKERPAVIGNTAEVWAKNRRTVIRVIPQ